MANDAPAVRAVLRTVRQLPRVEMRAAIESESRHAMTHQHILSPKMGRCLNMAVWLGCTDTIPLLLEAGADPRHLDGTLGATALSIGAAFGQTEAVDLWLRRAGQLDINRPSREVSGGMPAIHLAAFQVPHEGPEHQGQPARALGDEGRGLPGQRRQGLGELDQGLR